MCDHMLKKPFAARKRRRSVIVVCLRPLPAILLFTYLCCTECWVQPVPAVPRAVRSHSCALLAKPKVKPPSESDTGTIDGNTPELPANLRRKVRAERPALGHVVPSAYRQAQKASGGKAPSSLKAQGKALVEKSTFATSRLKIAAGTARGRRLDSPNVFIRPMMGKVKEAVYSTLTSFGLYDGNSVATRHLDIFAGSGSVGLESLSRGAAHCTFVDMSGDCCACIQRNLEATGLGGDDGDKTRICCTDAFTALNDPLAAGIPATTTYHIVTLCPPYEEIVYGDLLDAVVNSPLVQDDTVVLVEYPIELKSLPPVIVSTTGGRTAVGVRNRRYGRTVLALYVINPTGRLPPAANSRPEEFVRL